MNSSLIMYNFNSFVFRTFCVLSFVWYLKDGTVIAADCTKVSSCSCKFPDGTTVDLSPLDTGDKDNPKFQDTPGPSGSDSYSWNPCTDFEEGDNCKGVAVCNIHQNIPNAEYFNLGTTDSADFSINDEQQVVISYQYTDTGTPTVQRGSHIALLCDTTQEGNLAPLGEQPDPGSGQYYFELYSKYTCYANNPGKTNSKGLSAGTIICLGVLVLAFVYIIGGLTFNVFVRKSIGKERFPNVTFWVSIPGLIRDGVLFIVTRGKRTPTYDKI